VDLAFAPDDARLATASFDGTARLWDAATGAPLQTLTHAPSVSTVRFSADGARVITAGKDGAARVFDATSGKLVRTLRGHEDRLRFALFSPDGTRVGAAGGGVAMTVTVTDADAPAP